MWNSPIKSAKYIFPLFLFLTSLTMLPTDAVQAQQERSQDVSFDFSEVDIRSFIKIVSELTGQNYVIDPSVSGKITVTSPSAIPRDALPAVFQTVLNVYGFTAIDDGGIVQIVPASRAKQEGTTVGAGGDMQVETRIIHLNAIDATELKGLLQPLLTRAGNAAVHAASNTVVLTDLSRNIKRLMTIIFALDKAGPDFTLSTYPLQHGQAEAIAKNLSVLFSATRTNSGQRPIFAADDRSNTLLVNAPAEVIQALPAILESLDQPVTEQQSKIRVIHLSHADAVNLAAVLNAQIQQSGDDDGKTGSGSAIPKVSGDILITADPSTNALIVTASPEVSAAIDQVVKQLDIPRKQVLVEALIVEISTDRTRDLGLEWRLTDELTDGEYRGVGGTNLPLDGAQGTLQQTAANPLAFPPGFVMGIAKGSVSFGGVEFANIAALARAMERTSGVNILSTPHLLTLDNEEAEIIVGEERPFLKSSQTTDNGAVVRTYEFKDIGLTLRMTPRVTEDNQIVMRLFQESKNFVAESDVGAVTSTKRQAKTTIRVPSGQMAAIGGLIREDIQDQTTQVPCLGDIPGLGYLFKSLRKGKTKSNLLIFITPYIINNAGDLERITDKYREHIPAPETPADMKGHSDE